MKIDKIINEVKEYIIEGVKLLMLCAILYIVFIYLYAFFGVPM